MFWNLRKFCVSELHKKYPPVMFLFQTLNASKYKKNFFNKRVSVLNLATVMKLLKSMHSNVQGARGELQPGLWALGTASAGLGLPCSGRMAHCITHRIQSKNIFVLENFLRKEFASIVYQLEDSFYLVVFSRGSEEYLNHRRRSQNLRVLKAVWKTILRQLCVSLVTPSLLVVFGVLKNI